MKNILSFFLLCVLATAAFAADEQKQKIEAPVKSVIVYLTGAEVMHTRQVTLEAGRNLLVFSGLSSKLISKSIQFSAGSNVAILSISDRVDYLSSQQKAESRGKQLRDSVSGINDVLAQIQYEVEAYTTEKQMLLSNQSIGGQDKGVAIAELKLAADFYRARIKEINAELFRLERRRKQQNEILARLNRQLNEMNAGNTPPMAEISVLLTTAVRTTVDIELRYVVNDAGWAPSYDLLAEDVSKPIEMKYRAKVFNNTNVDWNDVKVKLSTADPMRSASKPMLSTWYLNFNTGMNYSQASQNYYNSQNQNSYGLNTAPQQQGPSYADDFEGKQPQKDQRTPIQYEEIQVSELSAEFDIKQAYSIPSDAKPYIIDVTNYTLPATYKHFSAPKIDRDAFLLARITGWENLDLVEGPANIYFGGTYVGQSYITTRTADDTLDLSLGRDNKVLVTRTKLQDFNNSKMIGTSKKVTYGYEITVKNNRKGPVMIDVEDQLPVSQDAEIIIGDIDVSKAEQESATGKLTWKLSLQPGETKKITLSYSVKYPKNKTVILQKTERRMRAKF